MTYVSARSIAVTTVEYTDEKGEKTIRRGGSRSWRNFNPGNISKGSFATSCGAIGGDTRFAIFPDLGIGLAAIKKLFKSSGYISLTLRQAIYKYAPPSENNSEAYLKDVAAALGLPDSTKISDLTDGNLDTLAGEIKNHEGWNPGSEYKEKPKPKPKSHEHIVDAATAEASGDDLTAENVETDDADGEERAEAHALSDRECMPQAVKLGLDVESLHHIQDVAGNIMKANGYGYTMHNACAATLSAFLNAAGVKFKPILGAGALAKYLHEKRAWEKIAEGNQQAGDIAVAENNVHIFLVLRVDSRTPSKLFIADNQAPNPHIRYSTHGHGRTAVAYFLRASASHAFVRELAATDVPFYPQEDEPTDWLTTLPDGDTREILE